MVAVAVPAAASPDIDALVRAIVFLRGQKVILDADLATLYGVPTKQLNKAVKRNLDRFPADFMFQLTAEEVDGLRFHSGTSNAPQAGHGGRRYLPFAFTEQGVAMLSGVLNSPRAVAVNIGIMRAFVRLRSVLASHADLARRIDQLEAGLTRHQHDTGEQLASILETLHALIDGHGHGPPAIGFSLS
jgi:hypothetical protein